jgi:hypothetical protein
VETGRARHLLSAEVLDRLIQWALVEKTPGGLALTPLGKFRLRAPPLTLPTNEKPALRAPTPWAVQGVVTCQALGAHVLRQSQVKISVNIERLSGRLRSHAAMSNTSRRSRIAEEAARLLALRRAIRECQIAINQSLDVIDATVEAIERLDRLQHPRPPDARP